MVHWEGCVENYRAFLYGTLNIFRLNLSDSTKSLSQDSRLASRGSKPRFLEYETVLTTATVRSVHC
jgi:hypothetical protein